METERQQAERIARLLAPHIAQAIWRLDRRTMPKAVSWDEMILENKQKRIAYASDLALTLLTTETLQRQEG